ncbi:BES1/BZR1 homolog protein 4-like [Rutidosis leptorrhynchoides]|uniref:BES1/BZR1 homolog protein 4-like n=1 Tax=Rutidosis leptorrhynchoides TaxID=125765 RepID=UPI003A98D2C2
MTSGTRMPTWKERENNKRRERRRRAIAAKIFAGLRMYGNYKLPKHCDNNEVLKAVADEAGWTVEPDGTTYRKGCKPSERMDIGGSTASPYGSYHPSPPSSIASPSSSSYAPNNAHPDSLIPWLKNLSSSSSSSHSTTFNQLYIHTGSISAPVTPPMSSPTAQSPQRMKTNTIWGPPNSEWFSNIRPASPTFSLVASNPFGFKETSMSVGGSRMWTPGQSGTCSPAIPSCSDNNGDVPMAQVVSDEFAFGSSNTGSRVKPWEGERIHEVFGSDDLELTLGTSKTR